MKIIKKYKVFFIIILLILLFVLSILVINKFKVIPENQQKTLSLNQIKESLYDTKKIYVCKSWYNKSRTCGEKYAEMIVSDESVINKIVDITNSLEEVETDSTLIEKIDLYSIYFLDENEKIIVSADFGIGYRLNTKDKDYSLISPRIEEIRNLLGISL